VGRNAAAASGEEASAPKQGGGKPVHQLIPGGSIKWSNWHDTEPMSLEG